MYIGSFVEHSEREVIISFAFVYGGKFVNYDALLIFGRCQFYTE